MSERQPTLLTFVQRKPYNGCTHYYPHQSSLLLFPNNKRAFPFTVDLSKHPMLSLACGEWFAGLLGRFLFFSATWMTLTSRKPSFPSFYPGGVSGVCQASQGLDQGARGAN